MDAMEFFRRSAGTWRSQRTTHHLPFRRSETGDSMITVEPLEATDERVIEICKMHEVDPTLSIGGAYVRWQGSMEWDKEDENHEGTTVFSLVPDADNPKQGRLLRERGYAEIVPIIGRYELDDDGGLVLTTEYDTMSSIERFWFAEPTLRLRTSTVKRFGGFSTASFCAETRVEPDAEADKSLKDWDSVAAYSSLGW
ncbi:MAG: phycobiliprotein lyase [Cyanobacteria bacterium P01_H01_bin.121]